MYGLALHATELGRVEMIQDLDGTLYVEHWDLIGNITTSTKARGINDANIMYKRYIKKYL